MIYGGEFMVIVDRNKVSAFGGLEFSQAGQNHAAQLFGQADLDRTYLADLLQRHELTLPTA
jgi:hypothetical protein